MMLLFGLEDVSNDDALNVCQKWRRRDMRTTKAVSHAQILPITFYGFVEKVTHDANINELR